MKQVICILILIISVAGVIVSFYLLKNKPSIPFRECCHNHFVEDSIGPCDFCEGWHLGNLGLVGKIEYMKIGPVGQGAGIIIENCTFDPKGAIIE